MAYFFHILKEEKKDNVIFLILFSRCKFFEKFWVPTPNIVNSQFVSKTKK